MLREYYDYIRETGAKEQQDRISEVRKEISGMDELFDAEAKLNRRLITMMPGMSSPEERQKLRTERQKIEEQKKELLYMNGYPDDFLNRKYRCDICRDSGYTDDGRNCTCCRQRAEEAYKWNLGRGVDRNSQ